MTRIFQGSILFFINPNEYQDLTWKLINDNNDGLTRDQVEEVLTKAFQKWHKITNLNFRKLPISDETEPDIVVSFNIRVHNDPYSFDGPGGTLAHAFYPHNNKGLYRWLIILYILLFIVYQSSVPKFSIFCNLNVQCNSIFQD